MSLDSGLKNTDGTPGRDSFSGVVVLADGRIQVLGTAFASVTVPTEGGGSVQTTTRPTVAYRLSAAGAPDKASDGDGTLFAGPTITQTSTINRIQSPNVRLLPDGSLVGVSGTSVHTPSASETVFPQPAGVQDLYLEAFRITAGGTLDPSFDGDGQDLRRVE